MGIKLVDSCIGTLYLAVLAFQEWHISKGNIIRNRKIEEALELLDEIKVLMKGLSE